MVFNITVISWRSVLLVKDSGVPLDTTDMSQVNDNLYHIMLYQVHLTMNRIVVIGTDCIGSFKYNYRTFMTMMAPFIDWGYLKVNL
jgi:hypothetical protein